jgi:phospholipid/cholesterol/gamma-HCH transport system substrate-binding protein
METNKNYFMVGLFVIIISGIALLFTLWLTTSGKSDYKRYQIRFSESVSGLSVGGLVKFRGVDVGNVEKITIDQTDTRLIRVDIHVIKTTPIKQDTTASLKLQGITGVVYIELLGGSPNSPEIAEEKDGDVPELKAQQSSIDALINRLPILLEKTTHIVDQIEKALNEQNIEAFGSLLKNANEAVSEIHDVAHNSQADVKQVTAHLNHTTEQLDLLLQDLAKTARNMRQLSENLKDNPSMVIFPPKQKGVPAP